MISTEEIQDACTMHPRNVVEAHLQAIIKQIAVAGTNGRYLGFIGREPEGDFRMIAGHPDDPQWVTDALLHWIETNPLSPWQAAIVIQLVQVVDENIPEEATTT